MPVFLSIVVTFCCFACVFHCFIFWYILRCGKQCITDRSSILAMTPPILELWQQIYEWQWRRISESHTAAKMDSLLLRCWDSGDLMRKNGERIGENPTTKTPACFLKWKTPRCQCLHAPGIHWKTMMWQTLRCHTAQRNLRSWCLPCRKYAWVTWVCLNIEIGDMRNKKHIEYGFKMLKVIISYHDIDNNHFGYHDEVPDCIDINRKQCC